MSPNPVLVEVERGSIVESRHAGAFAVVSSAGDVVAAVGDIERPCFARSAVKPIQAIAFVESGALGQFSLGDEQVALACASHGAEPRHVDLVRRWLSTLSLSAQDLECGGHPPMHEPSRAALLRSGDKEEAVHNNCSGKHCAMLATARAYGEDTAAYIDAEHPVQKRVRRVLSEMTDTDLANAATGTDGCGIPTVAMSLKTTAYGMARLANPSGFESSRTEAIGRIIKAVTEDPFLVAGNGRFCTDVMRALAGNVLVKTGAEGFFCAAIPTLGLGIALKVDDGASRASEVAMAAVLARVLQEREPTLAEKAQAFRSVPLLNVAGRRVGTVQAVGAT